MSDGMSGNWAGSEARKESELKSGGSSPENAPQLGTCDGTLPPHHQSSYCENWKPVAAPENACPECGSGDKARRMYQLNYSPPAKCINPWHDSAAPENQPRPTAPFGYFEGTGQEFKIDREKLRRQELKAEWARQEREWEAQGGMPQPVSVWNPEVEKYRKFLMELYADKCSMEQIASAAYILAGAKVEPGAHPPPDEGIVQVIADEYYWRIKRSDTLVELKDAIREALNRARAPQPAGSKKESSTWNTPATNAGLSRSPSNSSNAEITGTISAPSASESSSLNQQHTEAPVAPSKLSAQEFYQEWRSSNPYSFAEIPRDVMIKFAEAYAREYASSSNAALLKERDDWRGKATKYAAKAMLCVVSHAETEEVNLQDSHSSRTENDESRATFLDTAGKSSTHIESTRQLKMIGVVSSLETCEFINERAEAAESKVTALEGQLREAREIERGLVRQVEHYQKKAVLGDPKV